MRKVIAVIVQESVETRVFITPQEYCNVRFRDEDEAGKNSGERSSVKIDVRSLASVARSPLKILRTSADLGEETACSG